MAWTAAAAWPTGSAWAQAVAQWPNRPVKLIVSGAPGSATDIVCRVFAEVFTKAFGQAFVVDNRAGANGMLATEFVARAPNDGHTLLFTYAAAQVVNQSLYAKAGYDGDKDFAAITQIGSGGNFLVVQPGVPAKDLKEFIAYVHSRPADELAYGSWGIGSGGHLSMEALKQQTGLKMRHVPYRSTAAVNTDLLAGHIQVAFSATATVLPLLQSGKLKALAISGPSRSSAAPEVKTMTEQGVAFDLSAWFGLFAPAGTPRDIVIALNREANKLIAAPEMAERWKALAFSDMPLKTPEQFADQVRRDIRDWGAIVRAGGIMVD